MTKKVAKIEQQEEECAWEAGKLGLSVEHAETVGVEHEQTIDDSLGLQMISIRLPKPLIEDLKYFAKREGLGYQPLMRRILLRWTSHEYKTEAREQFGSLLGTPTAPASEVRKPVEEEYAEPMAAHK